MLHRPAERFTRQLMDGAAVARRFGVAAVDGFRLADVAAGGQGAPLAPLYHQALVLAAGLELPVAVLNLGGVGNVTFIDSDGTVIAFDTGPASALLDDFVLQRRGQAFDRDGALARAGTADAGLVAAFLAQPYFAAPAPKSLDRNAFHSAMEGVFRLPDADGAATLAAMTVQSVAAALRCLPRAPLRWIVAGGGRRNSFFMEQLGAALKVPVQPAEAMGWDGDTLEAELFGYLAVRTLKGLPLSLPSTTGVPVPLPGGVVHLP